MPDQPPTQADFQTLRDSIRELTAENKASRIENAKTYVRRDNNDRDTLMQNDNHAKDLLLIRETLVAFRDSMLYRIEETNKDVEAVSKRVDKINGDSDWLKKLVYSAILLGILASIGFSGAFTSGAVK